MPRSIRVGKKGKHQGSKGKYPVRVVRQILRIKALMEDNWTIEEIQRQFLFVRDEIEALDHTLEKIFAVLGGIVQERGESRVGVRAVKADVARARTLARDLVERLEAIEQRLVDEHEASRPLRSEEVAS